MPSVDVITLGCRLNTYESEAIRARAIEAGLQDTVIVNTCAVTSEAVRQSKQAIRRERRARPDARIVVTGCAAQTDPATFAQMSDVDFVLGNEEKMRRASYLAFGVDAAERVKVNDIFAVKEIAAQFVDAFEGRTRAFLQVQNGCDHRCTFCIIPFGRGNSRSVPLGAAVEEARRLTERGYAELVLTGVDITAYGADLPGRPTLGTLVRKLLRHVPDIARLRLSSIDPVEVDAELMRAIAEEERLMPHFHLSIQSGDDLILKRMKRRHSRRDIVTFCENVRRLRPQTAFGADFIAGFPTESEYMFENTMSLIDEANLTYLHVFPFSVRCDTPASRMPQVKGTTIKTRAARLRRKGALQLQNRLTELMGSQQKLLVERSGHGHTECFAPTEYSGVAETGTIVRARISGASANHLKAEAVD